MRSEGLIFDIKRFSINDGPGIRTTVFFKGCRMNCWWCHNPEGIKAEQEEVIRTNKLDGMDYEHNEVVGKFMTIKEVMHEINKENIFYEESGGGVTFSGGEPLLQMEFLLGLIQECKKENIHTAIDTSGFVEPEIFEKIINEVDLFLFDLKIMDDSDHIKYTGVSNKNILDNLKTLLHNNKKAIIRIPVIQGITDAPENIAKIKEFLLKIKNESLAEINLLPFHNIADHKYKLFKIKNKLCHLRSLNDEDMNEIKKDFENNGFKVKVGG